LHIQSACNQKWNDNDALGYRSRRLATIFMKNEADIFKKNELMRTRTVKNDN